jgi:predicted transposase/invertase (TIGR01784 family)
MLINLLKSFVELPKEEYEVSFLDTHLKPETEDDKLGILDVKVKTSTGKIINIEIQVDPVKNIGKRLSFYKSKLIVEQIGRNELYSVIQRVICICITSYELFPKVKEYLNRFRFYNPDNELLFEDIPEELYILELPKGPSESDGTAVWEWLQFLRCKVKEEYEMIAERNPEIRHAVDTLYQLSSNEEVRAEYEMRQKAWRDRLNQVDGYYQDGILKGLEKGRAEGRAEGRTEGRAEGMQQGLGKGLETAARNALAKGISVELIHDITGLNIETIKGFMSK